jgi:hypothetical protein
MGRLFRLGDAPCELDHTLEVLHPGGRSNGFQTHPYPRRAVRASWASLAGNLSAHVTARVSGLLHLHTATYDAAPRLASRFEISPTKEEPRPGSCAGVPSATCPNSGLSGPLAFRQFLPPRSCSQHGTKDRKRSRRLAVRRTHACSV